MAIQLGRKTNVIVLMLALVCAVSCFSLPIVHSGQAHSGFYERGDLLMSYFQIGDGAGERLASEWNFPTSIVTLSKHAVSLS